MPTTTARRKTVTKKAPWWHNIGGIKEIREEIARAKRERALANTAVVKEAAAQERVLRATTKIALQKAKADLKTAKMERQRRELVAKTALERAKAGLAQAKAAHQRASEEKWKARFGKIRAATGGVRALARDVSSGGGSLREMVVGRDAPKSKKQKKAEKSHYESMMDW